MSSPALKVTNLSVWIKAESGRRRVVDNISFSIGAGHATGLVGESGCGKSMTAQAILGLLPAHGITVEADGIEIDGKDISAFSPKQKRHLLGRDIAMIFQQPGTALDPVFTIGQQISAVCRRHSNKKSEDVRNTMLKSLQEVGFSQSEKIASAYPHQLSGGMRQLAMIAMATVCKPAVIIADEPTTALDSSTRALILRQLESLRVLHNTAILFISHDLTLVRKSCQNVMVMYCGRLMEATNCQGLFRQPKHPYSAALLSCIPQIGAHKPPAIKAIPGQVPSTTQLPQGCHFAPRCDRAEQQCETSVPAFESENGSGVACFRPL